MEYDYLFKILLVGNSGIGKSCLLSRFIDNQYIDKYVFTVGVDFKIKNMTIDNKTCKIQLWDTAGQDKFRTITSSYYRGSHGILLVYDTTDLESFKSLDYWLSELDRCVRSDTIKILVGTKSDLITEKKVDTNTAYEFAKKHGMEYFEVSSKSGKNVNETIYELCKKIKNGMDNEIIVKHSEKKKIVNNKVMVEKKSFFSRCLI